VARLVVGLLTLLALGAVLYWLGLVAWTLHALTRPPRVTYASAVARNRPGDPGEMDRPLAFEPWTITSDGRTLAAWDIRGGREDGPAVIVTHGWGSGKVLTLDRVAAIAPVASRVVCWDLPGHGQSRGRCTLGLREVDDLLALVDAANDGGRPLVLCGSSLGAGVSIAAAAEREEVALVIAEAPYARATTPAANVFRVRGLPTALNLRPAMAIVGLLACGGWVGAELEGCRRRVFDRVRLASLLRCPLVVLHGTEDDTSPLEDGRRIASACARGRLVEVAGGTHNGLWKDPASRAAMERAYADALGNLTVQPDPAGQPAGADQP